MKISFDDKTKVFYIYDVDPMLDAANAIGKFCRNPLTNRFETGRFSNAAALRSYADENVKKLIDSVSCIVQDPWRSGLSIPPTLTLEKFQRLGVRHALERNHSYLAFEQGLGKTPTAITVLNTFNHPTLILVPPGIIPNWKAELTKWCTRKFKIEVMNGQGYQTQHGYADVILCPDSIIGRPEILEALSLACHNFPLLIVDEAQGFINDTAERTNALFGDTYKANGLVHRFEKVLLLSGTPAKNRSIELFPVLSALAANVISFRDKIDYGIRYCGGYKNSYGHWDLKGDSNTDELHTKMHGLFMRREEKGTNFVGKEQRVIPLGDGTFTVGFTKLQDMVIGNKSLSEYCTLAQQKDVSDTQNLGAIANYRSAVGQNKLKFAAKWVSDILESTDEAVLLLGWHQDVITKLMRLLAKHHPLVIQGKTPADLRAQRVGAFMKGNTRLLIANLKTMVGLNIVVASRVVFAEISWSPSDNQQAEDRVHRIGQKRRVIVDYLVLQNTLDQYMLDTILKKDKNISKLINKRS